jgi:HSP20 family protein
MDGLKKRILTYRTSRLTNLRRAVLGSLPRWSSLPWPAAGQEEPLAVAEWAPFVDISESEEEYLIQAELPGAKKGAIKIIAEENTLTITGEREFEKEAMGKKRLRAERAVGSFGRRFSLPDDANPANVSTEFIDGVLTVRLAKKEKSRPQQEEAVDEITVWWQKTLGKKAVLGQASNRATPGQKAPTPKLLWTKPESGHAQQERTVVEATPGATEKKEVNNPRTQERKGHLWMDRSLTALGQLKHRLRVMVSGAVLFFAVVLLRFAGAVFVTIRAALGVLTSEFRRVSANTKPG